MKSVIPFIGLFLILGANTVALAHESIKLIEDKSGMPLCLISSKGIVRFIWNKDSFERDVFYEFHRDSSHKICHPERRKYLKARFPEINEKKKEWVKRSQRFPLGGKTDQINFKDEKGEKILTVFLSQEMKQKFSQVRLGGNLFRNESPEDYIKTTSLDEYTLKVNRDLTGKYGAGFSAEVYMQWLHTKDRNVEFRNFVSEALNGNSWYENDGETKEKAEKYTFAFVKGFGHTLGANDRYQPLIDGVRAYGMEVQVIYTEPYGRTPENTFAVKTQLNELLSQGKNLIVSCGSNGCLQLIAAISQLNEKLEMSPPKGYGKIAAMLSLSGVYYGSFAADWATAMPKWFIVRNSLHKGLKEQNIDIEKSKLDSFKDLTIEYVVPYLKPVIPHLPQKTKYFNLMGIPLHNGLVKDEEIGLLQSKTIRPYITQRFGANDGYIEFPGTELKEGWAPEVYTTALDASHAVMDGEFESIPVTNPEARQTMLWALIDFILSKID